MKRTVASVVVVCALFATNAARADDDVAVGETSAEPAPAASRPARPTYAGIVSGGASYRSLFGLPVEAADIGLGFGVDSGGLGLYVRGGFEAGRLDHGLTTRVYRVGGSMEGIVGRLRLGGGVDVLDYGVTRVTDGTTINEIGVGFFVLGSVDVVRFDDHALYLGARGDADWVGGTGVLGASLALGFRF